MRRKLTGLHLLAGWALTAGFVLAEEPTGREKPADDGWVSLFNGRDLAGWETSLGVSVGGTEPIGRGKDPGFVFQVVEEDGRPAIRISGEVLGGLTTREDYGNYQLTLEFKWGERRHAPRVNLPRDSGLLYHGIPSFNPASGWIESLEFGILEGGETGDFWSVPGARGMRVMVDVEGEDIPPAARRYPGETIRHRPGGKRYVGTTAGIFNSDDNEKPRGEWNTLELICVGQTAMHVVNGTVNMALTNCRRKVDGREEPVTRGRLQLQSEGAEVFFRDIRLRPIEAVPEEFQQAATRPAHNTLTDAERAQGWKLIFDGRTLSGWRGFRRQGPPPGWQVRDGALTRDGEAVDLITSDTFDDFELLVDWKISRGGNSGFFYRATEAEEQTFRTGPEYEIRDNDYWLDDPYTSGANYGLDPPACDAARPVGYWNRARIVVKGDRVEHWLNDRRVVQYDLHSPEWKRLVEAGKFRQWPGYGRAGRGHLGLQDHGDPVWFRNLKIRPISDP